MKVVDAGARIARIIEVVATSVRAHLQGRWHRSLALEHGHQRLMADGAGTADDVGGAQLAVVDVEALLVVAHETEVVGIGEAARGGGTGHLPVTHGPVFASLNPDFVPLGTRCQVVTAQRGGLEGHGKVVVGVGIRDCPSRLAEQNHQAGNHLSARQKFLHIIVCVVIVITSLAGRMHVAPPLFECKNSNILLYILSFSI